MLRGLPPSKLQKENRKEKRALSQASSFRLKPARCRDGEVVVMNLGKKFVRIGAEAQHLPLATPLD